MPRSNEVPIDRQRRRHLQSREEILDAALEVMDEAGVGDLNLTEVARRVGLRQPSLYQYFDSKTAVYDALFERGMRGHLAVLRDAAAGTAPGLATLRAMMTATVRFSVEHPVLSHLLFTQSVPGLTPSERAYRPSLEVVALTRAALSTAVARGELCASADSEQGLGLLIALTGGVASQQLANDPGTGFDQGRYARLIEPALDMYALYFAPEGGDGRLTQHVTPDERNP